MRNRKNRVRPLWVVLALGALGLICAQLLFSQGENKANKVATQQQEIVVSISIDGGITPATTEYIEDAFKYASSVGANALLIEMDTPGGLMDATRKIVQAMLAAPLPTIVYVSPNGARAGSAGVFITLAADVAAMAPTTHIGAAHPVSITGKDVEGHMAKKVENDAVAWARSLAEENGRNANWAEKAVRESASISAKEALKKNVIDLIASSQEELLAALHGRKVDVGGKIFILRTKGAKITPFEMSGRQKLVKWLSNPNLLYLLMLFGFLGVFIEFQSPGLLLPGIFGVLCLALVFGVQLLPVNWIGVLLILGAVAFFVAEVYITSFGLITAGGLFLLVIGSYLLFDVKGSSFYVDPLVIWSFSILFAIVALTFGYFLLRAKRQGPISGVDAMIGEEAEVYHEITPEKPGQVRLQGSYWEAYANETLASGVKVRVIRVDGTKVYVEKAS